MILTGCRVMTDCCSNSLACIVLDGEVLFQSSVGRKVRRGSVWKEIMQSSEGVRAIRKGRNSKRCSPHWFLYCNSYAELTLITLPTLPNENKGQKDNEKEASEVVKSGLPRGFRRKEPPYPPGGGQKLGRVKPENPRYYHRQVFFSAGENSGRVGAACLPGGRA